MVRPAARWLLRPVLDRLERPIRALAARVDTASATADAARQSIAAIDAAIGRLDAADGRVVNRVKDLEIELQRSRVTIAALRSENEALVRGWLRLRVDKARRERGRAAAPGPE